MRQLDLIHLLVAGANKQEEDRQRRDHEVQRVDLQQACPEVHIHVEE